MIKSKTYILIVALTLLAGLGGCIKNDLPYPVIKGVIKELETEGFVSSTFDLQAMKVSVLVADTVDLRNVLITRFETNAESAILPDQEACLDYLHFPDSGFVSLEELPLSANTRVNFKKEAVFTLRTYQDYEWKISVAHDLHPQFLLTDAAGKTIQVGRPIIDNENKKVIIYVAKGTDLSDLRVEKMQIGSSVATTRPEPATVTDFTKPRQFEVTAFDETEVWEVVVTHSSGTGLTFTPWTRRAYIMGDANENTSIDIRYKRVDDEIWDKVYSDEITFDEGTFTAVLRHLAPETTYDYEVMIGSQNYGSAQFTTDPAPQLPNPGFEEWHKPGKVWLVYEEGGEMFWDTGNWGSSTLNKNVTNYDEYTYHSGRRSAKLESDYLVLKFAAGNLFAGEYRETDGTNGILDFGRPFTYRPTALKGWFKYTSTPISSTAPEENLPLSDKGMPDRATIWVALGDWDKPVELRTKPSDRKLFDPEDSHVIAYQELVIDQTVTDWTEFTLNLDYRSLTRQPSYLLVVASASIYGDYFIGGKGSTLWLDDFELVYE